MNPPASIIRKLLLDLDLGTVAGAWPVYSTFLPPEPDESLCVYDTPGTSDGRFMATGEKIGHPGVQIRIRAKAYMDAFEKSYFIAKGLDAQRRVRVSIAGGGEYMIHNISRSGEINSLGVEEEGDRRRHHFTINAILTLAEWLDGTWVPFTVMGGSAFYVRAG